MYGLSPPISIQFGYVIHHGLSLMPRGTFITICRLRPIRVADQSLKPRKTMPDDIAQHYQFKHNRFSSHMQILGMVPPGSRVLDIGCGRGLISRRLAETGCAVVGIDRASPHPSFTRSLEAYYRVDLEQPLALDTREDFDCIIAADVLEHIRNRDQLLEGVAANLKPGGFFIASTGNIALFVYRLLLVLGRFDYSDRGILDRDHVHFFTLPSFKALVESAGFRIERCHYTPIPFELVFGPRWGRGKFVELLTCAYQLLVRLWPRLFAYQIIVEARLTPTAPHCGSAIGNATIG